MSNTCPELFIGLTGAVGTDLDGVSRMLEEKFKALGYATVVIVMSGLMGRVGGLVKDYDITNECDRIIAMMNAGDEFRRMTGMGSALAKFGILHALEMRKSMQIPQQCRGVAYIFKSLKHVEEVAKMQDTYGKNFLLVSVYSTRKTRRENLAGKTEGKKDIDALMRRDEYGGDPMGQDVRHTFPEADVFINANMNPRESIGRFVELWFGNTFHTPTREESGMMHAFVSSKASSSMSRQVGAAILTGTGDLLSTGINEVPKGGGGHYAAGDPIDFREWKLGYDSNTRKKTDALGKFLSSLGDGGWLSNNVPKDDMTGHVMNLPKIKDSPFLNLIEFGREVHAETAALMSALRTGAPVTGCTMYCTTFPCHMCAKNIIASGISRLVYIEPYPKSLAEDLHGDSMTVDEERFENKVLFEPFSGVSPKRYMELFEMMPRKDEHGNRIPWNPADAVPRYRELVLDHGKEMLDAEQLAKAMAANGLEFQTSLKYIRD